VLARSSPFMETEMGIFDCGHLDIGIHVNHSGSDVVTEEQLRNGYRAASIGNSDFGADGEVLHRGLHQIFRPGRTIDTDRLSPLVVPRDRHQRTQTGSVSSS
jgi:hypothetical protein